jgi:hypothetical protein
MTDILNGENFHVNLGDCIPWMASLPPACVDFSVYSPPFPSLFSYTSESSDIGNSEDLRGEAKLHFHFFFRQLVRIIKPGRVCMVHCQQIPALVRNNETSTTDFRGLLIRAAKRVGFAYDTDWPVTKNPQSQAIRTHSHKLLFVTMERDSAVSAPSFQDHLIKLRAPGINSVPIIPKDVTRNEWIQWAEGVWDWRELRETDTLNVRGTKGENDTKHICPLQLGVIDRLVRLYSNEGEIVFSPFAGIGSEGYQSLYRGRRFLGCELKPEYHAKCLENLQDALSRRRASEQLPLFGGPEDNREPDQQPEPVPAGANSDLDDI